MLALLLACLGTADAGNADVGGYFRVAARPDLQGGSGRLGYWNLYGRLLNEGSYGMLELRYDVLERQPADKQPWSTVHARIEGGSISNADSLQGSLAAFRLSQVYVKSGNVLLDGVTWQVGTLESFLGDLGLYDMRPATVFFDTVGLSARYESRDLELLVGAGDSGFKRYGLDYNALPTVGGTARLRLLDGHLELGGGGELMIESAVGGNVNAPYHTPGIDYEDWVRGEVAERYLAEFGPELADYFPGPEARNASANKVIGYLGFGGVGPLVWNNFFLSYSQELPQKSTTETMLGEPLTLYVHDFTDERTVLMMGNELQVRLWPERLDMVWGGVYGDHRDGDNDIVPSDHDRTYASTVLRLQAYPTETVHFLAETSLAREWSRNGNTYREHADSIFTNDMGRPDTRGLQYGDSDTRNTWQLKVGPVLQPTGRGIFNRPSLRLLYGTQYSNQNNAFGNAFVESVDQYNDFENVEQHWHHVLAAEAEVWF